MWFVSDGGLRQFKVVGVLKANEGFERWGGGGGGVGGEDGEAGVMLDGDAGGECVYLI